jgi:hypothetical protein
MGCNRRAYALLASGTLEIVRTNEGLDVAFLTERVRSGDDSMEK